MSQIPVLRILDASLNRATEGLRVVEDYARFVLDDPFLTHAAKTLRHDLASAATPVSPADRHAARDTQLDVGTHISTAAESERLDAWNVCAAAFKRAEQSLRGLEEYGKIVSSEFAGQCESLRYRVYTLEKAFDINRNSRDALHGVTLCVLLDGRSSAAEFEAIVKTLVATDVGMIQLRDKNLDDRVLTSRARSLRQLTRATRTLFVINDRADIAAVVGADGVHVGQEDLSVKDARTIVGPDALIGVSTHNISQARAAVLDGANYLGAGPTFPSQTKSFNSFAGVAYLVEVANEIRLPTFAIGGITFRDLDAVLCVGISRVAVGSAVISAENPAHEAQNFLHRLNAKAETKPILPRTSGLALDS